VRGCGAIERGPLVYCFEQADQPDGILLGDLAVLPGAALRERPVTLPGIGQTIEVTVDGVHLPPPPGVTPAPRARRPRSRTSSGTTATAGPCASGSPALMPSPR
jgi:hypothetical protein